MKNKATHVLLVEDEEAHAELIQLSFESRPDIQLTIAPSLDQARACLAETTPDLAIIDSLLPDGAGLELIRDLRDESRYPIVLLTSQADKAMEAQALAAGAARYVVKSEVTLFEMPEIAASLLESQDVGD
ncbi:MAG: response regulator [Acidobacteriota bacterium]